MIGQIKTYLVASLLLDHTNPRFTDAVESQRDAINEQLRMAPTKLLNLANDIVDIGDVNPSEIPMVVEEDGSLIVVEGNRRLAALKLLANPDLADDSQYREAIQNIRRRGSGPADIVCVLMGSRGEARHWLELRHTGENEGRGIVQWDALQSRNFSRRRGTQADRAALFCDSVLAEFPHEANLRRYIEAVRRDRLTTLGRFVSDPDVRRALGFDFEGDRVVFYCSKGDLLPAMLGVFQDLAGELGVSEIKNKQQRAEYVQSLGDALPATAARLDQPWHPGTPAPAGGFVSKTDGIPVRKRRRGHMKEQVAFQGLKLMHTHLRISKLLDQVQKVDIDASPAVVAVMVRVIVELVVTEALAKLTPIEDEKMGLKDKIRKALLLLDPNCEHHLKRDKALEMAWVRSQSDNGVGVQSMNSFVHNFMADPTPQEARTLSETYREMLRRLDDNLGGNAT